MINFIIGTIFGLMTGVGVGFMIAEKIKSQYTTPRTDISPISAYGLVWSRDGVRCIKVETKETLVYQVGRFYVDNKESY